VKEEEEEFLKVLESRAAENNGKIKLLISIRRNQRLKSKSSLHYQN